jgi:hypothetical protein
MLIVFVVCIRAQEAVPKFICYYVNMLCNYYIEINYDDVIDTFYKISQRIFNALNSVNQWFTDQKYYVCCSIIFDIFIINKLLYLKNCLQQYQPVKTFFGKILNSNPY